MTFDIDYIERLTKIIVENELTEISLEDGDSAITIRKDVGVCVPTVTSQVVPAEAVVQQEVKLENKGKAIVSPMVGTFYVSSSPDSAPLVEVGSIVKEGDVVCIIEAMKLMNEIKSEISGKITQICVNNGDPIEYGQTLMYVE